MSGRQLSIGGRVTLINSVVLLFFFQGSDLCDKRITEHSKKLLVWGSVWIAIKFVGLVDIVFVNLKKMEVWVQKIVVFQFVIIEQVQMEVFE